MMALPKRSRFGVGAACVGLLISISGCGDSTGPSKLDRNAALQSLALGMGSVGILTAPYGPPINEVGSFSEIAPFLDQINVTIDGTSQTMFALGLRESFPAGTCIENIFIDPTFPPLPGECTSPELGIGLILWQSHSASAPPDRLIFIVAEEGTSNFNYLGDFTSGSIPAVAIYLEGEDNLWYSLSGMLTSQVAATGQSCGLPLPPYAKSGSCSIATFDEQGAITFEGFSETGPTTLRRNLTIPRQTIHGLWQTITETQPITLPTYPSLTQIRSIRLNPKHPR
jgi:hypothetical protein